MKRLIRLFHRAYAYIYGYFWLPCPLCRRHFGGHEWKNTTIGVTTESPFIEVGVCDECAARIMARHPTGSVIRIDHITGRETVTGRIFPNRKSQI